MQIITLRLKNFRNYEDETINFSPKTNILCGDNAQGKTNALEALYMFSVGRSFRAQQDKDTILFGAPYTKIELLYTARGRDNTIEIIILRDKKKQIKINGVSITKLSELLGQLETVLFYPEELGLIKDGPFLRRRFLDAALCQARPKYYHTLGKYNKVLAQRNNLIKKIKMRTDCCDTLDIWNERLAEFGMIVSKYRTEYLSLLNKYAKKLHLEATGENLSILYRTRFGSKQDFINKLETSLDREIAQGCTLYGPHRDDIDIYIDENDAKSFASQGQQRSAVLSLKLAQAEFLYEDTGTYPILLLDDILSELDNKRRSYLISKIPDKQVIITCAGVDAAFKGSGANIITVKDGQII